MKKKILITILIISVLIVSSIIFVKHWKTTTNEFAEPSDSLFIENILPPPTLIYGFVEDSFNIEQYNVRQNQNLASILLQQKVDYQVIQKLVEKSRPVFDVRRIRAGNKYTFLQNKDTLNTPAYFIYEIDNTDYLVMELTDSGNVSRHQKQVEVVRKTGSGEITSSLWNAMKENSLNPMLAISLSEIYAWTVDFFGIEKGDFFNVIYEESYVDDISIGVKNVQAALFNHRGRKYYAFQFEKDSTRGFFDENGQSLQKAFLKAPLNFSRISSRFSNSRYHPILKISRPHHGIDYAAPAGTPVYSIGDGQIAQKGWDSGGGGNYLKIKHNSVYTSTYMHLQGFAKGINQGSSVRQGQLIGYVGSTGLATGPHLDFRIHKNGSPVDPLKVEAPPVEPVKEELMAEYLQFISPLKLELD